MKGNEVPKNRYQRALDVLKQEIGEISAMMLFLFTGLAFCGFLWFALKTACFPDLGGAMQPGEWAAFALTLAGFLALLLFGLQPVLWGALRWCYIISDRECPLSELFYYYRPERYRRVLSFSLHLLWRLLFLAICVLIPSLILHQIDDYMVLTGSFTSSLLYSIVLVLEAVALGGGGILLLYFSMRFFLAPGLLFTREDLSPLACIHWSVSATRGQQLDLLMMLFSLFPLYVLSITMVPLLFVVPYLFVLCALRTRELLNEVVIN